MNYKIMHFKSLTSTQDKAKEFARKGLGNIVVVSDVQTKGRGRFKRKWHSGKGGLWMSMLLKPKKTENMQLLTFAASIAVVGSIRKNAGLKTSIKWPNDVHYKGKKLCGILTEGIFGKNDHVIVGIGLNVNQKNFPDGIRNTAASLRTINHRLFDIEKIRNGIIGSFFNLYENCYNKNKTGKILKTWTKYCDTINKDVTASTREGKLSGKAAGIDKHGSLLLKLKSGKTIKIIEGDISIRLRQY